jgi:hypothetical protein
MGSELSVGPAGSESVSVRPDSITCSCVSVVDGGALPDDTFHFVRTLASYAPSASISLRLDVRRDPLLIEHVRRSRLRPPSEAEGSVLAQLPANDIAAAFLSADGRKLVIDWRGGGLMFARRHSGSARTLRGADGAHFGWMLSYVTATTLVRCGLCAVVHGGVVRLRDRNFLIAGPRGSGKTTLALLLVREGAEVVTDDITYVFDRKRFLPCPLRPYMHVRDHAVGLLPETGLGRTTSREDGALRVTIPAPAQQPDPVIHAVLFPAIGERGESVSFRVGELASGSARSRLAADVFPPAVMWIDELLECGLPPISFEADERLELDQSYTLEFEQSGRQSRQILQFVETL